MVTHPLAPSLVTTGPIRGSRKIFVEGPSTRLGTNGVRVAMRQVALEPSSGEPPVTLYDTSGPYTDPDARIDIMAGLPELRRHDPGRGDVEEVSQREVRPEDMGSRTGPVGRGRALPQRPPPGAAGEAGRQRQPDALCAARIITPEMEYVAVRENLGREQARELQRDGRNRSGRRSPIMSRPNSSATRWRGGGDHPQQHQPPRDRADGDRPQLPGQDQRQYRQQRGGKRRRSRGRQDGVVDPLGRGHGHGFEHRPQHPRHARMDHPQFAGADRHRCRSTRRWRRSAASPRS